LGSRTNAAGAGTKGAAATRAAADTFAATVLPDVTELYVTATTTAERSPRPGTLVASAPPGVAGGVIPRCGTCSCAPMRWRGIVHAANRFGEDAQTYPIFHRVLTWC